MENKTERGPGEVPCETVGRRETQELAKLWHCVTLLDTAGSGLTAARLMQQMSVSRATLYRYLRSLEEAGVAIEKTSVGGKLHYRLAQTQPPAVVPSPRQVAALHTATAALRAHADTELVRQIEILLRGSAGAGASRGSRTPAGQSRLGELPSRCLATWLNAKRAKN